MSKETINYYNSNAEEYVELTRNVNVSSNLDRFLSHLKPGMRILDFGCGSGRDSKYFLEKGFLVEPLDGSYELVQKASEYLGVAVRCCLFEDFADVDRYDGIWACASLLHISKKELPGIIEKLICSLHRDGVLFMSFKYGDFEGMRTERYYSDFTEDSIHNLVKDFTNVEIIDLWTNISTVPGRDEKWINIILLKTHI